MGQQALSFVGSKILTKINHITKNVKTKASFTYDLKRKVLPNCVGKQVNLNSKKT